MFLYISFEGLINGKLEGLVPGAGNGINSGVG